MMTHSRFTRRLPRLAALLIALVALAPPARSATVGNGFTYQGSLSDGAVAPTGPYDFRFTLFDAAVGGSSHGVVTSDDVQVTNGVFSVVLDFGPTFFGDARWLQVEVRQGSSTGAYTVLPRQQLTPAPYAISLGLPLYEQVSHTGSLLVMMNTGTGSGASFETGPGSSVNYGVVGITRSTGSQSAGVRGTAGAASGNVIGVEGVALTSPSGTGLVGRGAATGAFIEATGATSTGLFAYGKSRAIWAENTGSGPAIYATGNGAGRDNATLRIVSSQPSAGMCQYVTNSSTWATTHMQNDGAGEVLWLQKPTTGNFIVAYDGTQYKFWVDSNGVTHTKVLEILGGSDLSERFDVADEAQTIEPGTVVSIDPDHEGRLSVSRTPYDHRVAGIVSGAGGVKTGMLMGQEGSKADGAHPIALSGRVYCRASAVNGSIRPGDLLTTSSLPGHAMRVDDPARAQGAILGKAMGSLEEGEGLVLVLVGLQ